MLDQASAEIPKLRNFIDVELPVLDLGAIKTQAVEAYTSCSKLALPEEVADQVQFLRIANTIADSDSPHSHFFKGIISHLPKSLGVHIPWRLMTRLMSDEVVEEDIAGVSAQAVFREGIEIILFLTTIFFSSNPQNIFTGFTLGMAGALVVSFGLFTATLRLPVFYAFRATSILLILFAGGLLVRGIHEFAEVGILPEIGKMTLVFIPSTATFMGEMIKSVFGITQKMDIAQVGLYSAYVAFMSWWVFGRKNAPLHHN